MIGYFTSSKDEIQVIWHTLDDISSFKLQDLSWKSHTLKPSLANEKYRKFSYLFLMLHFLIVFSPSYLHFLISHSVYKCIYNAYILGLPTTKDWLVFAKHRVRPEK